MRFARPEFLYLLYALPVLIAFAIYMMHRQKKRISRFAGAEIFSSLLSNKSRGKEYLKLILILLVFPFLILGIANPQIGTKIEEVKQKGIEIYILLDISQSMLAEDLLPNRLDKAKSEINALLQKLKGDRIGLIIFAGDAYIQFPLTTDYSAAGLFLSAVDVNSIPKPGTAVASAINLALESFDYDSPSRKVIITITDGEDHEGDLESALSSAKDKSVNIYTIGMGSPDGAPIPVYDAGKNRVGFKQDGSGNPVITRLDEQTLQKIAAETGGEYYLSSPGRNNLDEIHSDLEKIEKSEYGAKMITDYDDKYYWMLIPALFLLLLELLISERVKLRKEKQL